MRVRRLRLRLSLRITLTFSVGALVVAAALAGSAYVFTYRFLVRQQQNSALHQAYINAVIVRDRLRAQTVDLPAVLDALATGSTTNTVIYRRGRWFSSSLTVSRDAVPLSIRTAVLGGEVVRGWTEIQSAPQVVVGVPLVSVDSAYFQLFDESSLKRTLATLRGVLLIAAAATTAAGAALGWWASRRLTAPLREVSAAAGRIATGDLDTRLPATTDADIVDLVASFNTMVDALRGRIERDARFAADVSHELRSPLTTLTTSLAVLRGRRHELGDRGREALDLLSQELGRFHRLVDDLLEISRADAGSVPIETEPVLVAALVRNLIAAGDYSSVPVIVERSATDVMIAADKRRLEQVLRNLLDNAATYADGATLLSVCREDERVVIAVDDAGPGVPVEDRERIFERFARGRNARRRGSLGGTGLGLALAAEHVRAHGGALCVTEAPSGGARFLIELPVVPS